VWLITVGMYEDAQTLTSIQPWNWKNLKRERWIIQVFSRKKKWS